MKMTKVKIEFRIDNDAFEILGDLEYDNILRQAIRKIKRLRERPPAICDAPEADDILKDSYGNTIGTVSVE
jgi:hypothetical protein